MNVPRVWTVLAVLVVVATTGLSEPRPRQSEDDDRRIAEWVRREAYMEAFVAAIERTRRASADDGPLHAGTLAALSEAGWIAHQAGDQTIADTILRRVVAAQRGRTDVEPRAYARALIYGAITARYLGEIERAKTQLDRAEALIADHGLEEDPVQGLLLAGLRDWWRRPDNDRALESAREAVAFHDRAPAPDVLDQGDALTWLGWNLFHSGFHDEAEPVLERALEHLTRHDLGEHTLFAVATCAVAEMTVLREGWRAAHPGLERCAANFMRAYRRAAPGFPRIKTPPYGHHLLALSLLDSGDDAAAWEAMQVDRGLLSKDLIALGDLFGSSNSRWGATRRAWYRDRASLLGEGDGAAPRFLEGLERWGRMMADEHREIEARRGSPTTLQALQAALAPDEGYWSTLSVPVGNRSHNAPEAGFRSNLSFLVTRDSIRWVFVGDDDSPQMIEVKQGGKRYVRMIERAAGWPTLVAPDPQLTRERAVISRHLLQPFEEELRGLRRLTIEFSWMFSPISFASLTASDGTEMLEHLSLAYVSSAEEYLALHARRLTDRERPTRALLIGNTAAPAAAALTEVRQEIAAIESLFSEAVALSDERASEQALREIVASDLDTFDVVHFAAHAGGGRWIDRWGPVLSGDPTHASDEIVDAVEVLSGWRLDAEVVSLGSCSIATNGGRSRAFSSGLIGALLGAGGDGVVATLWEVNDRATALLMTRFYENLTGSFAAPRAGHEAGERFAAPDALQEASLWLRDYTDVDGRRPFAHPAYWAGFVYVGVHR